MENDFFYGRKYFWIHSWDYRTTCFFLIKWENKKINDKLDVKWFRDVIMKKKDSSKWTKEMKFMKVKKDKQTHS